jgi:ubiquinone/menaquinone biosynthesis C-methylase UbiE
LRIEKSDAETAYEVWHERFDVDGADAPWHGLVREHLSLDLDVAGKKILEIGCGRGGFSCWLAAASESPAQIIAADFAVGAVRKGRAFAVLNGLSRIWWEVADIQAIPHPAASFDTVISCETIEHVPAPKRALAELARVLRPGGKLLVTTPNYLGTTGFYRMYLRMRGRRFTEVGQPINQLTLLPLTRHWVTRVGLQVTAVDAVGHYLPIPGRPPVRLARLDNPRMLMRWLGLHSLVVAVKP